MADQEPKNLPAYLEQRMEELAIPSRRALAARTGVSKDTVYRIMTRQVTPDELTLKKLAEGLPAPLQLLRRLAGRPPGERRPFVLPPEADQLTERQRDVVLAVVSALLEASTKDANAPESADASGPATTLRSVGRLAGRRRYPDGATTDSDPDDGK